MRFDYDEHARALLIEWDDAAVHRIPFDILRRACPCAACHGELGSGGRFMVRPDLEPGEAVLVEYGRRQAPTASTLCGMTDTTPASTRTNGCASSASWPRPSVERRR